MCRRKCVVLKANVEKSDYEEDDYGKGKIIPEKDLCNEGVILCNITRFCWKMILKTKESVCNYMTDSRAQLRKESSPQFFFSGLSFTMCPVCTMLLRMCQ